MFAANFSEAASLFEHPTVAVLNYKNKAAVSSELTFNDAAMVSEFMIEQLWDTNRFNIVEREFLEDIVKEHSLGMSGLVDDSNAIATCKLAGAQYLIAGSVTGMSAKYSGVSVDASNSGGVGVNKYSVVANITVRFIDLETGFIVLAASGTGESSRANTEFKLKRMTEEDYETTLDSGDGVEDVGTEKNISTKTYTLSIGADKEAKVSQVQVRNALFKAVDDAINNKNFGVLAKLDGKNKHRKV